MNKLQKLYRKYIYGIIGTLIFHLALFSFLLITEFYKTKQHKDESIVVQMEQIEDLPKTPQELKQEAAKSQEYLSNQSRNPSLSSQASNDAYTGKNRTNDRFFDEEYNREVREAKALSERVNQQLSQKIPDLGDVKMPAVTTKNQSRDSIRNVIYTGKSYNHYNLPNRYHVRFLIPTYLSQYGGRVTVDIVVDRMGRVIQAIPRNADKNPMIAAYAQKAALGSLFNSDPGAPAQQRGSITYTFVSQ
ncbi:MAG: hypothetical protein Q8862_10535 [Bacteroidota bacterium]|nr:hypothetical protein [Bacteroidota bacterium]